ncbi:Adaptive-response sensory-kinase SasA [bioreactor metagenome]|uniref:histidine kinase n=1 Tax=bioreactor metagenome TaxID=1076179 RepID=A0A645BNT0_9ZZZZ
MELIDLNKLIEQTLAELSDRMEKSGFMIKKNLPDGGAPIYGDGKKLYRVFLNLFDNALKYSMPGTRIFVAVHQDENKFTVRIQNTASYEMDFDESEIRERFVRGDKSRSTEGSGLGLSIAESFTKLCGGDFEIKTDGDQFTVILTFNRAE